MQTYLNISYGTPFINLENDFERYLTLGLLFIALVFYQFAKDLLPKLERTAFWAQSFFAAGIIATSIDGYIYPGSLKWLGGINFADIYLIISIPLTSYLILNCYRKLLRKK